MEMIIFISISTLVHDQVAKYVKGLSFILVNFQTNFHLKLSIFFFYFAFTKLNNFSCEMWHFAQSPGFVLETNDGSLLHVPLWSLTSYCAVTLQLLVQTLQNES